MRTHLSRQALTAAWALLVALPAAAQQILPDAATTELVQSELGVADFTLQHIDVPTEVDSNFSTRLILDGQPVTMIGHKYSLRTADFQVYMVGEDQRMVPIDAPEPMTFRGDVVELGGSRVAASLAGGQLNAQIIQGEAAWTVQPLTDALASADPALYVVHRAEEVLPHDGICGVEDTTSVVEPGPKTLEAGSGQRICEIAVDSDVNFLNLNGGSASATVADIETIINRMDDIYDNDVDTRFMITTIITRTTTGPYTSTSSSTLLNQFRNHWNGTKGFVQRDVAHLMTGKNLQGSVIGIAYLQVVCSQNSGYALSQSKFTGGLVSRTALTAHEVGHNYAAGHCSGGGCRIMCAGLGGCSGILTSFGTSSKNTIRNYSFGRPCTPELADALSVPVIDDFESSSINSDIWPANQGGTSSTAALNEPSGTRSLNLDAANSTDEGQDRILSNFVLLSGANDVTVSYHTQHRGVASFASLLVEYRNSGGHFELLDSVISDGSDQTQFEAHSVDLPANAYHDEFQIRFRTVGGTGSGSDWYIDDVAIGDACPAPSNFCFPSPNSVSALGSIIAVGGGSSSIAANDLSLLSYNNPPGQAGVFFYGPNQIIQSFGNGWLCVGGGITRLGILTIDPFGTVTQDFDVVAEGVMVGETTNFQFWFRDPAAGGAAFNTSDALEVNWCE